MKSVLIVLVIIGIGIAGFYAFNNYIYNEKQGDGSGQAIASGTDTTASNNKSVDITPISHATMILSWNGQTIYTDPVGGADAFIGKASPSIILITDIHSDHLSSETLGAVLKADTVIVAPKAVVEKLPQGLLGTVVALANGATTNQKGFVIEAVPMYNVPESATAPHVKGRGNGYIISVGDNRIYIAGDTGNTPEMRALKDIDIALLPMNLPYTMSVEDAAAATLAFKPTRVIPYHYRGQDGLSDTAQFKRLVNAGDPNIKVELLNFYP